MLSGALDDELAQPGHRHAEYWLDARRIQMITLMLRSLPRFNDYGLEEMPARKLAIAVSLYPLAVLSYGAGGLRGALEMLSEWVTGRPRIQQRTDG